MSKNKQSEGKVRFSIGTKLITIISFIVILSLGSITALVSWMVRGDLEIAAEENNFEVNRRAASEAEDALANMRAASGLLMHMISLIGAESRPAQDATDYFFAQNPRIAALTYTLAGNQRVLLNRQFFISRNIDPNLAEAYFNDNQVSLVRALAGETLLLNASPVFARALIAMFFPLQIPGLQTGGGVLFAAENLVDSFGFGANQSFMINDRGDILIHSDFALLREGVNAAEWDFIRQIQQASQSNKQELINADLSFGRQADALRNFAVREGRGDGIINNIMFGIRANAENIFNLAAGWISRAAGNLNMQAAEQAGSRYFLAFTKLNIGGAIVITGIEYNKVFEGIAATTRRNIYLTFVVLFISAMFIWFFSKTISTPLKELAEAAKSIENGQFKLDLRPKGKDEIELLGTSFQKMAGALNIFGKFTNRDIAIKAMRSEIKPGGLSKHATIFFSDIRGFTKLSENFTKTFGDKASDKIVFWLNNYFTRMIDCVEKTNGVVDKFIGDALMAHWGTAYTDGSPAKDAVNCIKAALRMRYVLLSLNRQLESANDPGNPHIKIGIGINTGIVTAGQLGSEQRMEYTVIGSTVNIASRVEALTKRFDTDILIAEDTWKLVGKYFITEEMPLVTIFGKEKPVRIFAVINYAEAKAGPRTLAEVRKLLGIKAPVIPSGGNLDAEEKKYKIAGNKSTSGEK
ncbi:MAG: HAMP domain-containing protein [Spirochaetes bacterium]|nr:HAMP domain-containing protein [Spirochaetota bacterium]